MLPLIYSTLATIGYQSSTIYNIPNLGGSGDASVQAVTFQATCRAIPNLNQAGAPSTTPTAKGLTQAISYPFDIGAGFQHARVVPGTRIGPYLHRKITNLIRQLREP